MVVTGGGNHNSVEIEVERLAARSEDSPDCILSKIDDRVDSERALCTSVEELGWLVNTDVDSKGGFVPS